MDARRPELSIRGAIQSEGAFHLTAPLATLSLFSESIEIRSTYRLLGFLFEPWHCRYDQLTEVQPINPGSSLRAGIRFKMRDSVRWVIFYTTRISEVSDFLRSRGVTVASPRRQGFLTPGA